jgi:hypothetical protein
MMHYALWALLFRQNIITQCEYVALCTSMRKRYLILSGSPDHLQFQTNEATVCFFLFFLYIFWHYYYYQVRKLYGGWPPLKILDP